MGAKKKFTGSCRGETRRGVQDEGTFLGAMVTWPRGRPAEEGEVLEGPKRDTCTKTKVDATFNTCKHSGRGPSAL